VDDILEYLEGDWRTLISCSLTSKGLFRSARRIIHRRLRLVGPGSADTSDEQEVHRCATANRAQLLRLSAAAERGLTRYTRELTIKIGSEFIPKNLLPHLPQFQTFALLTSLTLHHFDATLFLSSFERWFGHLAQQMRSLEFIYPPGPQDDMSISFPGFQTLRTWDSIYSHTQPLPTQKVQCIRHSEFANPGRYPAGHEHERLEDRLFGMSHPTSLWTSVSFNRIYPLYGDRSRCHNTEMRLHPPIHYPRDPYL